MQLSRNMLAPCSLLLIGLAGSDAARAQPSAQAALVTPTGSIAGTIRDASDRAPLARVRNVATTSARLMAIDHVPAEVTTPSSISDASSHPSVDLHLLSGIPSTR